MEKNSASGFAANSGALTQTQGFWQRYVQEAAKALENVEASLGRQTENCEAVLHNVRAWLLQAESAGNFIYLIGNGGSAATASHLAVDFWKNGKVRALTFNDSAQLTCLANDLSHEEGFAAGIGAFGKKGDLLIAISCSGTSENIVRAARVALAKGMKIITCSGFDPLNTLRGMGHANFYVPSHSYGITETLHQLLVHAMLDVKMFCDDEQDIFNRNLP
ncbi:MAG: SIS domain-containing protein, partial [Bacteroidota bacterium]